MFDVITTFVALEFYGEREGNPFLAWLLNSKTPGKWLLISSLKFWHVKSARFYMNEQSELKSLIAMNILAWAVVTWNFSVILRRKHGTRSKKEADLHNLRDRA